MRSSRARSHRDSEHPSRSRDDAVDPFVTLSLDAIAVPVTCDIACRALRRNASGALTGIGTVATVRTGPERPLGPGSGEAPQLFGAERTTRVARVASTTGAPNRRPEPGCSGPTFDGSRDRVDNVRVWGRRERFQRSLGPSLLSPSAAPGGW